MIRYPYRLRRDSASATIYRQKRHGYPTTYCLHWRQWGEKRRRTFTDPDQAVAEGQKILEHLLNGQPEQVSLGREQAMEYAAACQLIQPTGLPLVTVAREFMRTWKPGFQKATVRTVIKKWIEASKDHSEKYQKDLCYRLPAFERKFGGEWIDKVDAEAVREWIQARTYKGNPVGGRTKTNWLRMLCSLWGFARERHHLPQDRRHALQGIKEWPHRRAASSLMDAVELKILIGLCDQHKGRDQLLPFLYLMAFAGLRTEEAKRLTYEDLVIRSDEVIAINVNEDKAKTRTRRSILALPVFASHMKEFAVLWERKGPIAKWSKIDLILHRIARNNPVHRIEWGHNQLRHTFATHLLREWGDPAKVAEYLGTSPAMINSHYRELVPPEETEAWMEMRDKNPKLPPPKPIPDSNAPPF